MVKSLINEYKDVFDFNIIINSTLFEINSEMMSEFARIKELFDEQKNELINIRNEHEDLNKQRDKILQNEIENIKEEINAHRKLYDE